MALDGIPEQDPDSALVMAQLHKSANYTQGFENIGGGGVFIFWLTDAAPGRLAMSWTIRTQTAQRGWGISLRPL